MSDNEDTVEEKAFSIERAKLGRAACKKCKQKCAAGEIRIAKIGANPFGEGKMKTWHHVECIFEMFLKQRPTTKRIESGEDIEGFDLMSSEDQELIEKTIEEYNKTICAKYNITPTAKPKKKEQKNSTISKSPKVTSNTNTTSVASTTVKTVDYPFKKFRKLVADITNISSYIEKTNIVRVMFTKGPDGAGFHGDMVTWCRLLLPGVIKRIYNLQSKILVKIFSKIFLTDHDEMLEHLEQGDIGETITHFFENSNSTKPAPKSKLTINEVDSYLQKLSMYTKQDDQTELLKKIAVKCTGNDLKVIIRLIKHDLRMNAGAKHILDAVHPKAYESYQSCRDIKIVIEKCTATTKNDKVTGADNVKTSISLMTPILPMLAEACKSVEYAMKKCPNGMYSEIKYDGERVQLHKKGVDFKYYSRSLKPVMPHKIAYFKDYIPQAFPKAEDLILDCEILMVDSTGKPLPFGTLGIHKKSEFRDATVCLFVFDCLYYNGDVLTNKPIKERKRILHQNMQEVRNHVMFSEYQTIYKPDDLSNMIAKVLQEGLEGLVLKDLHSIYEPGKRHWLKIKKDYLFGGAIADSADLLVLGAWYGTGKKGGIMSVFLMGVHDKIRDRYCTVTKVHTGHDDKTLEKLQNELDMVKIHADITKVPNWLKVTKTMVPDFVARDPKAQPVWEITGAEFTQNVVHTAEGISIRFPRVTRIRDDKNWETATTLDELKVLVKNSKHTDVSLLLKGSASSTSTNSLDENSSPSKKRKLCDSEASTSSFDSVKKATENSPKKMKFDTPRKVKKVSSDTFEYDNFAATSTGTSTKVKKTKTENNDTDSDISFETNKKFKKEIDSKDSSSSSTSKKKCNIKEAKLEIDVDIENPLPDYFKGVKLLLEPSSASNVEVKKWLRYFVAFGGDIISTENWRDCNIVLHKDKCVCKAIVKAPPTARHIHVDWLKYSVKNEEMLDFRPFLVKLVPYGSL